MLAVERLREAGPPFAVGLGRDVGHRALAIDKVADGVAVVSLVAKHDFARFGPVKQRQGCGRVARLTRRKAEPEQNRRPRGSCSWARLGNDQDNDLATLFRSRRLLVRPDRGPINHLEIPSWACVIACISRPPRPPAATAQAMVAGRSRSVAFTQVTLWHLRAQHPEDAITHAPVTDTRRSKSVKSSRIMPSSRIRSTPLWECHLWVPTYSAKQAKRIGADIIAAKIASHFSTRLTAPDVRLDWWRTAITHTGIAAATPPTMIRSQDVIASI